MIYFYFFLDYFLNFFLPFKTFFIVRNISHNKYLDILIISIFLDILYAKSFYYLIIFTIIYLISKVLKIRKKILKETIIFIIIFNIFYLSNIYSFYCYIYSIILSYLLFVTLLTIENKL